MAWVSTAHNAIENKRKGSAASLLQREARQAIRDSLWAPRSENSNGGELELGEIQNARGGGWGDSKIAKLGKRDMGEVTKLYRALGYAFRQGNSRGFRIWCAISIGGESGSRKKMARREKTLTGGANLPDRERREVGHQSQQG